MVIGKGEQNYLGKTFPRAKFELNLLKINPINVFSISFLQ